MSRMWIWFFLSVKRWLRHKGFAAVLLAMPVVLWGIQKMEPEETEKIRIGVSAKDQGLGAEIAGSLSQADTEGMFEFVLYQKEEELKEAVAARKVECAYLFPEDLEQKLREGNSRRSIIVYTAPSTVLEPLAGEVVFSALASRYNGIILQDYMEAQTEEMGQEKGETAPDREEALFWYHTYLENGSTFRFEYQVLEEERIPGSVLDAEGRQEAGTLTKKQVFPVRGLIGIFVFLSAFFSACNLKEDEKKGLFFPLPFYERLFCKGAALAAPVFLAVCAGLISLFAVGDFQGIWLETGALAACGFFSVLYGAAVSMAVPRGEALAMIIPALALSLLLVCPVFIDAGKWFDFIGNLQKILPPAWYLKMF
ncbi:MAG: hypothetical protein HFG43_03585 [Lachnospiraceae bacterium]|nr:hypothetical protein [Lachnospiraceae bacterium]